MKTGIYRIQNLKNSKVYVGSTSQRGFNVRKNEHWSKLRNNKHCNAKLQNAWNKHGEDAFVFDILLICDPEMCVEYEQLTMDHYKPEYNLAPKAGSNLGIKFSEKIRRVNSERNKGSRNAMYGKVSAMKGKNHSVSARSKMSKSQRGSNNPSSRLTESDIPTIRRRLQTDHFRDIALDYGVSYGTIHDIKQGRTWNHIHA